MGAGVGLGELVVGGLEVGAFVGVGVCGGVVVNRLVVGVVVIVGDCVGVVLGFKLGLGV